ncbi:MAG: hypothetical protein JW984_15200 [Deltaproteobacteria bacterium]|uniref:DNA-binding protein n=1 Tax=Candidatus Zymogenus saltonus TaxID=2844893 RepID=A0A9D8KIR1_9DELT|nr:hypothetical protein [Candidatus Zymogenus saltonus]
MNEYPDWLDKKYRKPLLKEATAAELLSIHVRTLKSYRQGRKPEGFPDPVFIGVYPRYKTLELIKYLEKGGYRGV